MNGSAARCSPSRRLHLAYCEDLAVDRGDKIEGIEECFSVRVRCREQLRSRNEADDFARAANARPLGAAEEEQLVFDDRPAYRVAELVAGEDALLDALSVVVKAVGCKRRNAVELVKRAVEIVRAGFGRDVDDAA